MPNNRENLIEKINEIVSAFWAENKRPLLLSSLPTKLMSNGLSDYKDIADGNLKKFIESSTDESNYKLLEHPLQKAKIGVMPKEQKFEYSDIKKTAKKKLINASSGSEESTVAFLKSLSKLSDEELESIVIPTKVLVRLLRKP